MKRFVLLILGLILCASAAKAQSTAVTASVIDTDGTIWVNGTWKVEFVPNPSNPNINQYYLNGIKLYPTYASSLSQSGSLNGGTVTINTLDNSQITPEGSMWKFTFCPMASSACGSLVIPTTGSTYTIPTSSITAAIPAPRFAAVQGTYGYADVEAQVQITPGSTYYNVINSCSRTYSPSTQTWQCGLNLGNLHNSTWISIAEYGAVGNCNVNGSTSACADNTAAIQNAINYCYTNHCAVYFPSYYTNASQGTIYYVASTINPEGVSLFGPSGAAGSQQNLPQVGVRGAPGEDVFAIGDPASYVQPNPEAPSSYVLPYLRFSVKDLQIIVDSSVDCSSSGTASCDQHRFPGRHVFDLVCDGSTGIVTSNTALFQPGDVGQAFEAYGCGSGGANLTTTIASWQSQTQVTLAAVTSTAQSAAEAYISVMGLSATQTIGNAGFAYDNSSTASVENGNGMGDADFTNVNIRTTAQSTYNNQVAFFFQGSAALYHTMFNHINLSATFGLAAVPSDAVVSTLPCGGICDENVFFNPYIAAHYPILAYGGSNNDFDKVQLSTVWVGPTILDAYVATRTPTLWHLDFPEEEPDFSSGHACPVGWQSLRIAGNAFTVDRINLGGCSTGYTIPVQWDASFSTVGNLAFGSGVSPFNITGNLNHFWASQSAVSATYNIWNDTGGGNVFVTCGATNQTITGRCQYAGGSTAGVGQPMLSRGKIAFDRTSDFIDKGPANYFLNKEDLWLWPSEVMSYGSTLPAFSIDSTNLETGSSVVLPTSTTTNYFLWGSNGTYWSVGSQIPATYLRVWFYLKASGSQAFPLDVTYGTFGSTPNTSLSCSLSGAGAPTLTTTWTWYSCDVNASSVAAGSGFGLHIGSSVTSPTYAVSLGGFAIVPWNATLIATSFTLGQGSTPMTSQSSPNSQIVTCPTGGSGTQLCDAAGNWISATAPTNVPAWLQNLGTGADGTETCNGNLSGDYYYTTFSVPNGDTCTINAGLGLTIHATGACTISGTIVGQANTSTGVGGGGAGGSGGGTAAASTSNATYYNASQTGEIVSAHGTSGGTSGGSGGAATAPTTSAERAVYNSGAGEDGLYLGGGASGAGGTSGGAAANGGGGLVLICASITGTGTINLSGAAGNNSPANNSGASAGGGGGVAILSSQATETFGLTINVAAGAAGSCLSFTGCGTPGTSAAGWYTEISGW
jgi:hypothetical protein